MTRKIFKYSLAPAHSQMVGIPDGAKLLHVADQSGVFCIWADVDPDSPAVQHEVRLVGTGDHTPPAEFSYLGTVLVAAYVWHVYARKSP